jgi:ABC-type Zn uptake system ZnuABC Zn-binding protein ZnuA
MKNIIRTLLSLTVLASLLLAACQQAAQSTPVDNGANPSLISGASELKVLAVESFLADIAQNVAGDRVQVETLVPLALIRTPLSPPHETWLRLPKASC